MSQSLSYTFGDLLKQTRKRAAMTQGDLAAAVGYSISSVSAMEKNRRLPDVDSVLQYFVPALGLQEEPKLAVRLVELASAARGERLPETFAHARHMSMAVKEEITEELSGLPAPPTELVGREQEVRNLAQRLLGHAGRLLTLVGPPGIGKTRLALSVAEQLQPHYRDGARFVPLAAINDPALVASNVLAALKVVEDSSKSPQTVLIEHLRRKEMLLVLDNFEQLIAPRLSAERPATDSGVELIAELLAQCAGLRLLVTSRERLHLRAEQRYRVPPLALKAAVTLFAQHATAVDADFMLTEVNRSLVEAICERVDRLPLALELCAAQVDLLSLSQLLAGLRAHPLDLLVAGAQDLPARQRTLRTAIGRSYALLQDDERALFRRLGVFTAGFEWGAMDVVENGTEELGEWRVGQEAVPQSLVSNLRMLVGKSLVHSDALPSGDQRFLLLETLREFALEQLRAHGEEAEMRRRHYLAYLHLFRTGDGHLRGAEASSWFARLDPELGNLRAALQWALDEGLYTEAAWLLVSAGYFCYLKGDRYEGAWRLARLLPHRHTLAVDLRLAILIDFIASAGNLQEFPSLDQYRAEIMDLIELCPRKPLQAAAWFFLAQSDTEVARAVALAREASESPEVGPEFGPYADHEFALAAYQVGYANSLLSQGEVTQAMQLFADSLQRFRKQGNQSFIAECLGGLGELALLRGDIAEARTRVQEIMSIGKAHNLRTLFAEWQWLLGLVTLYGGDVTEAHGLLEEAMRSCLALRNTRNLARTCTALAETALWERDAEQVAHWLEQSMTYHPTPRRIDAFALQRLFIAARLATLQGQYQHAATLFGVATAAHRQIHQLYAGPMLPLVQAALATVRKGLNAETFAAAFARGEQLAQGEAMAALFASDAVSHANLVPEPVM